MNIAKVKEKQSVSKSAKEKIQAMPKELLRRGLLDGTEKLRGQLRDAAEGGQRQEDVSDRAHDAAARGTRLAADKLGNLVRGGRKNREQRAEKYQEAPSTTPHTEGFGEGPATSASKTHTERPTSSVQPRTEPSRIKARESASGAPSAPTAGPHTPLRTKPTASAPNQPVVKTKENYIRHQAEAFDGASPVPHEPPRSTIKTRKPRIRRQSRESAEPSLVQPQTRTQASAPIQSSAPTSAQTRSREKFVQEQGRKSAVRFTEPDIQHKATEPLPEPVRGNGAKNISVPGSISAQTDAHPIGKTARDTKAGIRNRKKVSPVKASHSSIKVLGRNAQQTIKTAEQTTRKTVKTAEHGAKAAQNGIKVTRKTVQAAVEAPRRAVQAARAAEKIAATSAKAVAKAAVSAIKAAITTAQELAAAIATCGGAVVAVVLVLCLVAALLMSPLGVFLSGEENSGQTMVSAVREINQEYDAKIEELKAGVTCDEVSLSGTRAPWPEILAVYAVKTTSDPTNGQEVVTMDDAKKELLKQVFWDMNELISFTSTVPGGEDEEDTTTLYITVSAKTADEMADIYGFTAEQRQHLAELLSDEHQGLWGSVLYGIGTGDGEIVVVALSQVGNIGGQPYWSWYGFASRVDWCAIFVSWCANECGYIDAGVIPKFAGCVQGSQWFKDRGLWQDRSYTPNPGDILFFDWNDPGGFSGPQDGVPDHVGIVERVENGRVYTVEGNSGDKCCQRSYPVGYYEIFGYGTLCP